MGQTAVLPFLGQLRTEALEAPAHLADDRFGLSQVHGESAQLGGQQAGACVIVVG